jgi:hypothetical protein
MILSILLPLSAGPHVGCLEAFAPRRRRELDRLAILQRLESLSGDLGMMDEQVFPAIVRGNETKTLLLIKPLYHTSCHFVFSLDPPDPIARSLYWFSGVCSEGGKYTP